MRFVLRLTISKLISHYAQPLRVFRWDHLVDLSLRRLAYGVTIGGAVSLLLFRGELCNGHAPSPALVLNLFPST